MRLCPSTLCTRSSRPNPEPAWLPICLRSPFECALAFKIPTAKRVQARVGIPKRVFLGPPGAPLQIP